MARKQVIDEELVDTKSFSVKRRSRKSKGRPRSRKSKGRPRSRKSKGRPRRSRKSKGSRKSVTHLISLPTSHKSTRKLKMD